MSKLIKYLGSIHVGVIEDQRSFEDAQELLKTLKKVMALAKIKETEDTQALKEELAAVRAPYKAAQSKAKELETQLKTALGVFKAAQETKAQAIAAEPPTRESLTRLAEAEIETTDGISITESIDIEVTDINLVPSKYKNQSIRKRDTIKALKEGKEIPGVRAIHKNQVRVRN